VDSYLKSKIISQNIRKILYLSQKNLRSVVNTAPGLFFNADMSKTVLTICRCFQNTAIIVIV
jgi:hypothetical protein